MIPLVNKPDQFVWAMPYGKPDGTLPLVDRHNDTRPRVVQSAQKGDECWYERLNRIRTRIGKGSTDKPFSEDRKFERFMSGYRKSLNELFQTNKLLKELLHIFFEQVQNASPPVLMPPETIMAVIIEFVEGQMMLNAQTKQKIISFFESNSSAVSSDTAESYFEQFCTFLEKDYIKDRCVYIKKFIEEKLESSPRDFLRRFQGRVLENHSQDTIPPEARDALINSTFLDSILSENSLKTWNLLHEGILLICYQNYHLQRSKWTPSQSIENLLEELKDHGPLTAVGKMGLPFYKKPPHQLREPIGDQTVWGWKKGDYDSKVTSQHGIIVIGAENLAQKTIVFIDPNDPSDPNQKHLQKIYRMSYERFVSSFLGRRYLMYNKDFRPLP